MPNGIPERTNLGFPHNQRGSERLALGGKTAGRPAFLALTCHEFVNVVQRDESKAIVPFADHLRNPIALEL